MNEITAYKLIMTNMEMVRKSEVLSDKFNVEITRFMN